MKTKVVPKLRQEVKVKVDIVTSDDIKTYYTGKFQDFTARYIIKRFLTLPVLSPTYITCILTWKGLYQIMIYTYLQRP